MTEQSKTYTCLYTGEKLTEQEVQKQIEELRFKVAWQKQIIENNQFLYNKALKSSKNWRLFCFAIIAYYTLLYVVNSVIQHLT